MTEEPLIRENERLKVKLSMLKTYIEIEVKGIEDSQADHSVITSRQVNYMYDKGQTDAYQKMLTIVNKDLQQI